MGKAWFHPHTEPRDPQRVTAQPHSRPWDTWVPCPGTGGISHQSSCSRSVHSSCRISRVQGLSAPDPPLHPFPGSPQPSLPILGTRQCQDVPLLRGLSSHGVTTGLSCSRGGRSWAEAPWSPPAPLVLAGAWPRRELALAWAGSTACKVPAPRGPLLQCPQRDRRSQPTPAPLALANRAGTACQWLQGFKCCPS